VSREWSNWSGSLRFAPNQTRAPEDEEQLAHLVRRAAQAGASVRVVGSGHSSSSLVATSDILVSLEHLRTIRGRDGEPGEVTIGGGVTLDQAGKALLERGLACANLGDIDSQTVAGAIGTGTHGTGLGLPTIAAHLVGGHLVTGTGDIVGFGIEDDPERVRALRVSLGVLGIVTALRLRLVPAFRLRKRQWCARTDDCVLHFAALATAHRHVDFYWYPRSDEVKIRTMDPADDAPADVPFARLLGEEIGWSNEVIPNTRQLRFEEMEYALPLERGLACFAEVRDRTIARWRHLAGWRVLYRTVAPDDTYLSMASGRPTATISLHQNNTLPFWPFFRDIEPIFRAHEGRPHWGKQHTLRAPELRPLYPMWDRFLDARQHVDPAGVFLTPYLRTLLGVA
jgi:FAD/FMN-containing dehydrogenase